MIRMSRVCEAETNTNGLGLKGVLEGGKHPVYVKVKKRDRQQILIQRLQRQRNKWRRRQKNLIISSSTIEIKQFGGTRVAIPNV